MAEKEKLPKKKKLLQSSCSPEKKGFYFENAIVF